MGQLAKKPKLTQIVVLIRKLSERDKARLLKRLEEETWANQLESQVQRIRTRFKTSPITDSDIDQIVEEVRERRYASRSGRL